MSWNERWKIIQRALARYGMHTSSWLINHLPFSAAKAIMNGLLWLGYLLVGKQKNIARESLRIAFEGKMSEEEIESTVKQCFRNLGKGMIELIYFMAHPQMIRDKVYFEGRENLDEALAQGKGIIAISAHFGSFPLMLLKMAQEDYKMNAIIRPARDQKIEKYFNKQRSDLGLNTIYALPRKQCVDTTIRALRNNEIVFIPLDQNFGSGGKVFVEFFGRKAATATGPVIFAKRTGSLILPMFIIRDDNDRYKIIIEPAMPLVEGGSDEDVIFKNVTRMTNIIEDYIRKYPHEWGWMHRRWKSRPDREEVVSGK